MNKSVVRSWTFASFLKLGLFVAVIGYTPLQLYILFGPSDGNPVGLGLLFVMGMLAGLFVVAIGFIRMLFQSFGNRGK
jgi:hypothetical protein